VGQNAVRKFRHVWAITMVTIMVIPIVLVYEASPSTQRL